MNKITKNKINQAGRVFRFENMALSLILVLMIAIFWIEYPQFLARVNIINILLTVSIIGIISVPWSMLSISGGLDISVGSVMGFSAVVISMLFTNGVNLVLSVIIGLIASGVIGLINGLLITKVGINSIIVTLGMLSILRSAAYIIAGGRGIPIIDDSFRTIGLGRVWIFPIPVVIMAVLFVIGYLVLNYSQFGRNIYVAGGNEKAAEVSGINIDWIRISLYIVTSMGAGLGGFIVASQFGTTQPKIGTGYEFAVITAVVLGGISLGGGIGNIIGTLLGVLIIGTLRYGLTITGIHSFYQTIGEGLILLIAVTIDQIKLRKTS